MCRNVEHLQYTVYIVKSGEMEAAWKPTSATKS